MPSQARFPRIRKWEYLPQGFGLAAARGSMTLAVGARPTHESARQEDARREESRWNQGPSRAHLWHRWAWEIQESLHDVRRHPWFYALSLLMSAAILSMATRQFNSTTPRQARLVGLIERAVVALEEDNRLDSRWPR